MAKGKDVRLREKDIDNYKAEWETVDSQSANADSKVGWSTAFFALILSSLLAIGLTLDSKDTWIIISPFMVIVLISIFLLVIAMNPNPTSRKIINYSNVDLMFILRRHVGWEENRIHWQTENNALFEKAKKAFIKEGYYKDIKNGDNGLEYSDFDIYFDEMHHKTIKRLMGTIEDSVRNYRHHIDRKLTLLGVAYMVTFPFLMITQAPLLKDMFTNPYDKFKTNENIKELKKDAQVTRRQNYLMRSYIANPFGEEL